MTAHDVACRQLVELVTDYLEGALAPSVATRFEEHLVMCRACNVYVEQMRAVRRATGRIDPEALSPETRAGLLHAFRGWRDG